MDQREEQLHLKQYVKHHPENQMAWYLLGKEYMRLGKDAKANYCFIQAGEVYEAFEKRQHPIVQKQQEAIELWMQGRKRKALLRRSAALLVLLLGLTVLAPSNEVMIEVAESPDRVPSSRPVITYTTTEPGLTVAFVKHANPESMSDVLGTLLYGSGAKQAEMLAVSLEEDQGYRLWTGKRKVLLSAKRSVNRMRRTPIRYTCGYPNESGKDQQQGNANYDNCKYRSEQD